MRVITRSVLMAILVCSYCWGLARSSVKSQTILGFDDQSPLVLNKREYFLESFLVIAGDWRNWITRQTSDLELWVRVLYPRPFVKLLEPKFGHKKRGPADNSASPFFMRSSPT